MTDPDAVYGYLITDIEDSTPRWEIVPNEMKRALKRHKELLTRVIERHGGRVENSVADSFFAIFESGNPLGCAYALQSAFDSEDWSSVGGLKIRIGIHIGRQSETKVPNWQIVNRTSRICDLAWGGQTLLSEEALKSFDLPPELSALEVGSFRLKGVLNPIKLFDLVGNSISVSTFPPPRASEKLSDNLPHQSTPFFGRKEDLAAISEALKSGSSGPICLRGAGGAGKTRLAIEYGLSMASAVSSYFVSLERVSGTTELVSKIAGALNFPFNFNESREDQLLKYLSSQRMILILDNADTVSGGVSFINRLANFCRGVSVLVTSRVLLKIEGGINVKITGLLDAPEETTSFYDWPSYQLFEYSARLTDPTFKAKPSEELVFKEICDLLGGLPIAIKLAAQWVKILTMKEIRNELRNNLKILNSPDVVNADNNVGLFSVFEKSWRMLSSSEREKLCLLTYFSESFDSQAAKQVLDCDVVFLSSLESRSLLDIGDDARFRFHPVIREYLICKTLMDDSFLGELHCDYYFDKFGLFVKAVEDTEDIEQNEKLDRLFLDIPNFLKAWRFAIERGYYHHLQPVANSVFYILMIRSHFDLAKQIFSVKTQNPVIDVFLNSILANCLVQQGDYTSARQLADSVLKDINADEIAIGHALHAKGNIAHASGELTTAEEFYSKALIYRVKNDEFFGQFYSYSSTAISSFTRNAFEEAKSALKNAYRACSILNNVHGFMTLHLLNGDIAKKEGRLKAAKVNYNRSLDYELGVKSPQLRAVIIRRLRQIAVDENDHVKALKYAREAGEIAQDIGDLRMRVQCETEIGLSLMALREHDSAKESFLDALKLSKALNLDQFIISLLKNLESCFYELGKKGLAEKIGQRLMSINARTTLAGAVPSDSQAVDSKKQDKNNEVLGDLIDELLEQVEFKDLALFD